MSSQARILLVDDNEVDFVFTQRLLSRLGEDRYHVDWAPSFEAAVRTLEHGRHDVCLVDYQLGDRDGLDLLREAAQRGFGVPMILLTGRGDQEIDTRAMSLGASGYLEKENIDGALLDRAVRYAMSREGMLSELIEQNQELNQLHKLTELALQGFSEDELAPRLAERISRSTGYPMVALRRLDLRRRVLSDLARTATGSPLAPQSLESAASATVVTSRRARVEMDIQSTSPLRRDWTHMRTLVAVPMTHEGRVIGTLELGHDEAVAVDSVFVERAMRLANHVAGLLESRRVHASPETDPLSPLLLARDSEGDDLSADMAALLRWYEREAERCNMRLSFESHCPPGQVPRGDATRLRRVMSMLLGHALRYGVGGEVLVQSLPASEAEDVLVSFQLPIPTESVDEWDSCLEVGQKLVGYLGGSLETFSGPGGSLRVLMGARVSAEVAA